MAALFVAVRALLAILALRGVRVAYAAFMLFGLLYFPAKVGFRLDPHPCEALVGFRLALSSLANCSHIVLFALCFLMSRAQFRSDSPSTFAWAALMTVVMGALVELAEGATGNGHCRLRDLIPDSAGAVLGMLITLAWRRAVGLAHGWSAE